MRTDAGSEQSEHDRLALTRTLRVFNFLKALHEHRNPVVRAVSDYSWQVPFSSLPDHPLVERGVAPPRGGEDGEGEMGADAFILRVGRPETSNPPAPPYILSDWLVGDWTRPGGAVDVKDVRRGSNSDGTEDLERFEDEPARRLAFGQWKPAWDAWSATELPARQALDLFNKLFALHQRFGREGERLELVLGEGRMRWRTGYALDHPILLLRAQLEFDPEKPEFTIIGSEHPPEFYGSLFQGTPVEARVLREVQDEIATVQPHPLGGDETTGMLRRFIGAVHAAGALVDAATRAYGESPVISRDPILFVRDRSIGFGAFIDGVIRELTAQQDGDQAPVPSSLSRIVGVAPSVAPDDAPRIVAGEEPADVLLSKPANPEQIRVARQLNRGADVLVQGPPGTGKTHTIANLLGHLLAQGKSVLVTSHTTKALRVLREKVVEPLQPLCVSVLDSEKGSQDQLDASITAIVGRLSSSDVGALTAEGDRAATARLEALNRLRAARARLLDARQDEYRPVVIGGVATSPLDAARLVADRRESDAWVPGPLQREAPLPLSVEELVALYQTNASVTPDDEREIDLTLPDIAPFIPPDTFASLLRGRSDLLDQAASAADRYWQRPVTIDDAAVLETLVERCAQLHHELAQVSGWELAALDASLRGPAAAASWGQLADEIESAVKEATTAEASVLRADVELPFGDPAEHREIAEQIIEHLAPGKELGKVALLLRSAWKRLVEAARVDGRAPSKRDHFILLRDEARLRMVRDRIARRWARQVAGHGGDGVDELGTYPERTANMYVGRLRSTLAWASQGWEPALRDLRQAGLGWQQFLDSQPARTGPNGDALRVRHALGALLPILAGRAAAARLLGIDQQLGALRSAAEVAGNTEVASALRAAVRDADPAAYGVAHERLMTLSLRLQHARRRRDLLARLRPAAPMWAREIEARSGVHGGSGLPDDASAAWQWRQFEQELTRRHQTSMADLQQTVEELTKDVRSATARVIELRAWTAQVARTTPAQQQALMGYRAVKARIGKATGKRAPELLAQARKLMGQSREAVPVWIMPLSQAVQTFSPSGGKFDVVIIDEASQCDVLGLSAFYLAKQVVVVGDDEQVSPDAVGQKIDIIGQLRDSLLGDVPNATLYDGQLSVYELAKQSFPASIRLVEHFRCVPEIIDFSNHLSYGGEIKPLRDASQVVLQPATIAHRVLHGHCDARNTNSAEAEEISALIAAMVEQPEYAEASIGVVSLLGDEQAELIEREIRRRIPLRLIDKHRILCGNAAQFQGDERTVMFLSTVKSGDGSGPVTLMNEGPQNRYKKRFNVAASRAQDQMWVVHSLTPDVDLKPDDLRKRLIQHAENPQSLRERLKRVEAQAESEFERRVLRHLESRGYRVTPQWWAGRYRIDMVVHGDGEKRMAVECDGEQYHQDLAADMERQAILERLGWRFIRIRGSRFFSDQARTFAELEEQLRARRIEPLGVELAEGRGVPLETGDSLSGRVVRRASILRAEWRGEADVVAIEAHARRVPAIPVA